MKLRYLVLVIFLSLGSALAAAFMLERHAASIIIAPSSTPEKETAQQRVLRTGEIRCGYAVFAPYFTKDIMTDEFAGIWHDYTEALGAQLGLKIIWAEEVGLGDVSAALDANRIDVYCGGLWTPGKRVRVVDFLKPSAYEPLLVYVRVDDHRFDDDLTRINDPGVSLSTIDGEGGQLVAAEDFPKTRLVSLPQLSNYADMFNQVVLNKADVVIAATSGAAVFLKTNPGALRPLLSAPLRVYPVALAIKYGEESLRDMLNQAQDNVLNSGEMDKILSKYETNKNDFWRVAPGFTLPQ